jgi:cbb3-type cytochrome oxidase maturation protein
MEVIYLLIPLSLMFLALSVWFFLWAMKTEQYDDLDGPAHRIILDDRETRFQQKKASEAKIVTPEQNNEDD